MNVADGLLRKSKMADWRQDPATDAQIKRLKQEGIDFSRGLTKGEASDLISDTQEAGEFELEVLKFFRIPKRSEFTELTARKKVDQIFADPKKKQRWENRPASQEQKDIYAFFKIPIPAGLKYRDAEAVIDELFEDEKKQASYEDHASELDDRESWFEDSRETINYDSADYGSKKIPKALFRQIVERLEGQGYTLEQIENMEEDVFRIALELKPDLRRASSRRSAPESSSGCLLLLVPMLCLGCFYLLGR